MISEPIENSPFKFLRRGADGAAVISVGDFPQDGLWIAAVDAAGMADGNVAVDLPVDQQDGDLSSCDCVLGERRSAGRG